MSQWLIHSLYLSLNPNFHSKCLNGFLFHPHRQWLKWKIRGEGTVYQLWAKMGPQQVVLDSFYEI